LVNYLNNFTNIKKNIDVLNPNVKLIVVTKSKNYDEFEDIIKFNHNHFGENRVQEAKKKWQSIKLQFLNLQLHPLDSIKLAGILKAEETRTKKKIKYFIQVNIGDELQKSGIHESQLPDLLRYCKQQPTLDIVGLMCIPPNNFDAQIFFNKLKSLSISNNLKELSMGMSNDYECAIKSGATFVRVGSFIFRNN